MKLERNLLTITLLFLWTTVPNAAELDVGHWVKNEEYGFRLHVPTGLIACIEASGEHPHGFSILLRADKQGCMSRIRQPYMGVFGDYNVLFDANPSQSLRRLCPQRGIATAPDSGLHLAFSAHASAVCHKDEKDGWIDIFITTQGGKWPDHGSAATGPYINYTAQLHTNAARLTTDLVTFRQFISMVQIPER
jgi:hypothetical protein